MSDRDSWTTETMMKINDLTPDIKGKAFDPDWFLLRQRFEAFERESLEAVAVLQTAYSPTPTADAPLSVLARWAAVEVLELREQVKEMRDREENEILYKARGLDRKDIKLTTEINTPDDGRLVPPFSVEELLHGVTIARPWLVDGTGKYVRLTRGNLKAIAEALNAAANVTSHCIALLQRFVNATEDYKRHPESELQKVIDEANAIVPDPSDTPS